MLHPYIEEHHDGHTWRAGRVGQGTATQMDDYSVFGLGDVKGLWKLDGGYELVRAATDAEWAIAQAISARALAELTPDPDDDYCRDEDDGVAAREQAADAACEAGILAGAAPAPGVPPRSA